jgi:hypothetical protein
MAAGAVDFMAVAVVAASTAAEVDSMAAASAELAEVGVVAVGAAAGVVGGAVAGAADGVAAGEEAGVIQAGDAAGVGVIPVGVGGLASALVGVGVPIGEATRMDMGMDIPIIPTIRTTQTMGRTVMRQRTRIAITTVPAEIRVTTRSGKI